MKNTQQEETLEYFRTHAKDWHNQAQDSGTEKVNIIQQRNDFVIKCVSDRSTTKSALDIGCGTGDLACELSNLGISATGIDFSQDMIDISNDNSRKNNAKNARFECCSAFDFDLGKNQFDLISANGFIEYISQQELAVFLDKIFHALPPNGSIVLGSRNRLYNLFSLNAFTQVEINGADLKPLLQEATTLAYAKGVEDMLQQEAAPLQDQDTKHSKAGVSVTTRFQYTPFQLINMLTDKGFKIIELSPVHIHSMPIEFKNQHPEVHTSISTLLQSYAHDCPALLPFSSTFMVHAKKGA